MKRQCHTDFILLTSALETNNSWKHLHFKED